MNIQHTETWILVFWIIYYLVTIIVVLKVLFENRKPIYSAALIGLLITIPIGGLILYFFVAYKMNKSVFVSKKWHKEREQIKNWKSIMYNYIQEKCKKKNSPFKEWNKIINMLYLYDNSSPTYYNEIKTLINGEEFFPSLIEDLKKATKHINIEFYIFDYDFIGKQIIDILISKAQEGVKIRFIIDSFGSHSINRKLFKLLKQNNIEVFSFLPIFTPKLFRFVNIRDHRKLVTIDGKVAYTGGINIARRYLNSNSMQHNKRFWRDTAIMVKGEAVKSFELQFFDIWKFVSSQQDSFEDEIFCDDYITNNECLIQLVDSGPDSEYQSIMNTLIVAITNAQKEILIETPYFCPPEEILSAIQSAALCGITIKIILPEKSDNIFTTYSTNSFIDNLASIGVNFYLYKKGFIHSKVTIIDHSFVCLGSTNYDYRSYSANYELNTLVFDPQYNNSMKLMFYEDLKECEKIDINQWKNRRFICKVKESICRLFSPLI